MGGMFERFFRSPEGESKKEKKEASPRMELFLKRMKRAGLLAISILGLGSATAREARAGQSLETAPVSEKADSDSDWSVAMNEAFALDETGAIEFRPSFVFAPVQGERTVVSEAQQSLSARLDLPVALQFAEDPAAFEAMNAHNQEAMRKYVEQALVDQFADRVRGFNVLSEDHDLSHEPSEDVHVTSVRIIGGASPEARNADSITPGNVDWENVETAWARVSTQAPIVIEQLKAKGVTPEVLAQVAVEAQENQFTDNDLMRLGDAADKAGFTGATEETRIYKMLEAYNHNEIVDPAALQVLDEIVAPMRSVVVEIQTAEKKSEHDLIPIPVLPLLLFPFAFARRGRKARPERTVNPQPETVPPLPISPEGEPPVRPEEGDGEDQPPVRPDTDNTEEIERPWGTPVKPSGEPVRVPPIVESTPLPEQGSPDYRAMLESTVVHDLMRFLGDERTINRGLDYEEMVEEMSDGWNEEESNEGRELRCSLQLLDAWRAHDIKARKEMGWEGDIEEGLDYKNQPKQIKWAKMHARVLRQVADEFRKLPLEEQRQNDRIRTLFEEMSRPMVDNHYERNAPADVELAKPANEDNSFQKAA